MGLFDRFRNNKKQEQAVRQSLGQGGYEASASSHQNNNPSDNESQAMRTIYALSKFCGSVMLFTGTREEAAMPNFFQFCYHIQSSYRWTIMLLCNKEGETPSGLYISPRFKDYMDCDGGDLNTYLWSHCISRRIREMRWSGIFFRWQDGDFTESRSSVPNDD